MLKDKYILLIHKKLSGQISLSEASELKAYRMQNPAQDKMLEEIEELWKKSESSVPEKSQDVQEAKNSFFQQIKKEPEKQAEVYTINRKSVYNRSWLRWVAVAASLIIVAGYFVFTGINNSLPQFMHDQALVDVPDKVYDSKGELADGSSYWLKKGSVLKLDENFNKENRIVYLEGELFIHVKDNIQLPFNIIMSNSEIKVLGTAFYVRSGEDEGFEVEVAEGSVSLTHQNSNSIILKEGDLVYLNLETQKTVVKSEQNPIVSNWKKTYLNFRNAPLEVVFNKLSVFYGVEFDIDCKTISKMKGFTSLIQNKETPKIESYLISLQKVYHINIDKIGVDSYKVYGGACK